MDLPQQPQRSDRLECASPAEDLRVINEFAVSLLRQQTIDDLLWVVAEKIGSVLQFEDCVVYLVEGDRLIQRAAFGVKNPSRRDIADPIDIPLGGGIVGMVASTGVSRLVVDTSREPDYIVDTFVGRSELAVPICFEGRVIGVIDSECSRVDGFTRADQEMVEWIANIAASRIALAVADRELVIAQESLRLANESLEERVRASTEELAQALSQTHRVHLLESVGQLAGDLAHDFNNLLTTIQGNISLAQIDAPDVGELRDVLAAALHSCQLAQSLPTRLLALSDGGAPTLRTSHGIAELIRDAAVTALRGSEIECQFDLPVDLPAVDFDSVQIRQVVRNLLLNSRQAMCGEGRVQVVGRVVEPSDPSSTRVVEFEIRDVGPGVPEQYRDSVFDPYFSTVDGHTGLGLTIAQSIMVRHGGRLDLDPSSGGACFRMRLPCSESYNRNPLRHPVRAGEASVLVMDDEPGICDFLARVLPRLGHRVTVTACGDEALKAFHRCMAARTPFDLVILDLTVPGGMGGRETLEALRRSDPGVPAIVMSGYSPEGVVADPLQFGFQAALAKPFDVEALRMILGEVLGE